jgi:hypothetical protein
VLDVAVFSPQFLKYRGHCDHIFATPNDGKSVSKADRRLGPTSACDQPQRDRARNVALSLLLAHRTRPFLSDEAMKAWSNELGISLLWLCLEDYAQGAAAPVGDFTVISLPASTPQTVLTVSQWKSAKLLKLLTVPRLGLPVIETPFYHPSSLPGQRLILFEVHLMAKNRRRTRKKRTKQGRCTPLAGQHLATTADSMC